MSTFGHRGLPFAQRRCHQGLAFMRDGIWGFFGSSECIWGQRISLFPFSLLYQPLEQPSHKTAPTPESNPVKAQNLPKELWCVKGLLLEIRTCRPSWINLATGSGKERFLSYPLKKQDMRSAGLLSYGAARQVREIVLRFMNRMCSPSPATASELVGSLIYQPQGKDKCRNGP